MIELLLWWGPIAGIGVSVVFILLWMWFQFPQRSADDVIEFLQHVDLDALSSLLDPLAEAVLRSSMTSHEFRRLQRKRVHLCIELMRRMIHNVEVLLQLAQTERKNSDPDISQAAVLLNQIGVPAKVYCVVAIIRLRLRLLFRVDAWFMFGAPSLSGVREALGIRGLDKYDQLKTVASNLFLLLKSADFDKFVESI